MNVSSITPPDPHNEGSAFRAARAPSTGPAAIAKLRKAAAEFEATLLSSWWTSMKQGGLSSGEEDSDPGKDTLDQLGMQAMSAAVASGRGGLGIGDMLVRSLLSNHPEIVGQTTGAVGSAPGVSRR